LAVYHTILCKTITFQTEKLLIGTKHHLSFMGFARMYG
jgi:hypothetical protein